MNELFFFESAHKTEPKKQKFIHTTAMKTYENSDERYTKREAIIPLMPYLPRNARYWLPCDTEDSNFVKVFREYGLDFTHSHIFTGQDFYIYEPDKWDILVTNPPFANKSKFVSRVLNFNKPFALLLPLTWINDSAPYTLFAERDLELMIFDRRMTFIGDKGNGHISFKCGYYCMGILPKQIVFERLRSDKNERLL